MGHYVGIDYGTRRIGLALADPEGILASPADVVPAVGRPADDARQVVEWARQHDADRFVVGLPLNMDGTDSDQTRLTREFAAALEQIGVAEVTLWDERLTSYEADALMNEAQIKRGRQKAARDAIAALVILRGYLDSRQQ